MYLQQVSLKLSSYSRGKNILNSQTQSKIYKKNAIFFNIIFFNLRFDENKFEPKSLCCNLNKN